MCYLVVLRSELNIYMPTKITAAYINILRSSLYSVLGTTDTGYGAGLVSGDVSVGQTITTSSYRTLIDDLRRCWIHQTGSLDGFFTSSELPIQGSLITQGSLVRIGQLIDQVSANRYNTVPSQQLKDSLASSTSTIYENSTLTYEIDHSFNNAADANYFFNLGGSISVELSHVGGTEVSNIAAWANFIVWANSQLSSIRCTRLQWDRGNFPNPINVTYTSSTNHVARLNIYASSDKSIRSVLNVTNVADTVSPPPTTAAPPGIPTIGTATATGTSTATISFTAPASDGGAAITSYTATSNPGGRTGTLSQAGNGTITVTGLTAGTAYTFTVTATNSAGTSAASGASNSITTYSVPVNTVAPAVSGTVTVGQTLTTTTGTWTGTPTPTYAYQWKRGGADISGATGSTYTLVSADIGSVIRCVVTATNAAGSASANSNATSSVTTAASGTIPVNTVAPVVSGTAIEGQTLTTTTGTWTGSPTPTYAYQWKRGGADISGATGSTYTLVSADIGSVIRCVVTATNTAGSASANSNATSPVAAATARTPTYEIIPMATSVVESMDFTFYVSTSNVPDGTELRWIYVSPRSGTTNPDFLDINGQGLGGSIYIYGSIGSITLTARDDGTNEGTETFTIRLFKLLPGGTTELVAESDPIIIYEKSAIDPASQKYTITPEATSVTEGVRLRITVDTVNVPDGTELGWTYDSPRSGTSNPDFQDADGRITITGGTITIYGNSATFEIRATDDGTNEGTETFTIKLFRLVPGSDPVLVKTSDPITIYELYALTTTAVPSVTTLTSTAPTQVPTTTAISVVTYSGLGPSIQGYYGVASPVPQAEVKVHFGEGQTPPIIYTKNITVSQPGAFTLPFDSNSNSEPVTITNTGNTATTITNIVFDEAFVPNYFITGLGGFTVPLPINPLGSFTFDLIYYLSNNNYEVNLDVPYSINFSIYSDAIVNPVTVNTQLTVVTPVFDFYLTPNEWNYTYLFRDGRIATLSVTVGGKGNFTTISYETPANFSSRGFSIKDSTTVVGFDISFNPAGLSNGSYTTTVNIGINGVTREFRAAIILDVLPNITSHLGHWVSALQRDNGVIGASYDIINGTKCITLGFGSGADGGSIVGVSPYGVNVNIDNLGIGYSADIEYTAGPVLYPGGSNVSYSNFLKPYDPYLNPDGHGVWVNDTGWYPVGKFVARTFTFTAPVTGNYSYRFAADNQAWFSISGVLVGDLRSSNQNFSPIQDFFYLIAGIKTLVVYFYNDPGFSDNIRNPASVALVITDDSSNAIVWDSNWAIRRRYTAYQYWNEVYRIPLYDSTATDAVFYSKDYIIKNLSPLNGFSYGSAFGYAGFPQEGSMFTVFQDRNDNVTIVLNPKYREFTDKTTNYASYLFYYYTGVLGNDRLTDLENNRGDGQTRYFTGFDKNGAVTTSILPQPAAPYIPPAEPDPPPQTGALWDTFQGG